MRFPLYAAGWWKNVSTWQFPFSQSHQCYALSAMTAGTMSPEIRRQGRLRRLPDRPGSCPDRCRDRLPQGCLRRVCRTWRPSQPGPSLRFSEPYPSSRNVLPPRPAAPDRISVPVCSQPCRSHHGHPVPVHLMRLHHPHRQHGVPQRGERRHLRGYVIPQEPFRPVWENLSLFSHRWIVYGRPVSFRDCPAMRGKDSASAAKMSLFILVIMEVGENKRVRRSPECKELRKWPNYQKLWSI